MTLTNEVIKGFNPKLGNIMGQMLKNVIEDGYDRQPALTDEMKDVLKKAKTKDGDIHLAVVIRQQTKTFQKYISFVMTGQSETFIKDGNIVIPIMLIDKHCKRNNYKEIWADTRCIVKSVFNSLIDTKLEMLNNSDERYLAVDFMTDIIKHNYYNQWTLKYSIEKTEWMNKLADESKVIMALTQ
jgi:ribosomal protein L14